MQAMLASSGASCSSRLKVSLQSVGAPAEKSRKPLSSAPPSKLIAGDLGDRRKLDAGDVDRGVHCRVSRRAQIGGPTGATRRPLIVTLGAWI